MSYEDIAENICAEILVYFFGKDCFNTEDTTANKAMDDALGHFFPIICEELDKL